jgi:hypothetical protein
MARLKVLVFGKKGCQKCGVLNQRLEKLFADPAYADFEKLYCDVETKDGLLHFCEAECINPSRIPALLVAEQDEATGRLKPLPNPEPGRPCTVCKDARLYQYLGLQTDYSEEGKGVLSPKMIKTVLDEARAGG